MVNFYQAKKKSTANQKHQLMTIERFDHQGAGIAYLNRKPIFIEGTLPGEKVLAQITEEKSKYAKAQLIKIQQASEQRIEAFCPHYQTCGGCNLQHLDHDDQISLKAENLQRLMKFSAGDNSEHGLDTIIRSPEKSYRRRARFSLWFDNKSQALSFGFRQKGSKSIVDIESCPILVDELNTVLPALRDCLAQFSNLKSLGHVELVFDGERTAILLRAMAKLADNDEAALLALAQQFGATLYLQVEDQSVQRVIGEPLQCQETGQKIDCLPTDFIQVNQQVNKNMVIQAMEWLEITKTDRVLDLFCGLGNFSLSLATQAQSVIGIEGVPAMVERAKQNAQLNGLENLEFYHADLEQDFTQSQWAQQRFDKVLLDPARAGAHGVIEYIGQLSPQRVLYVSCNPTTLSRDSQVLLQQGYELKKLSMLDMFPHTSHLESMALFVKSSKKKKGTKKPHISNIFK